jgi:hypothetical protein
LELYLEPAERVAHSPVRPPTDDNPRALWPENVVNAQALLDATDSFIGLRSGRVADVPVAPSSDPTISRVALSTVYRANQDWATIISQEAANYNLDAYLSRRYAGRWLGQLSFDISGMRERGEYRVARLVSMDLTSVSSAADGSILAVTRETWDDRLYDSRGNLLRVQPPSVEQTYQLVLDDGAWKIVDSRLIRTS